MRFPQCRAGRFLALTFLNGTALITVAHADQSPQGCFTQDWSDTTMIQSHNDWSGVPGIIGRRGSGLSVTPGQDPQLLVAPDTTVDVEADRSMFTPGTTPGVIELEDAVNPAIVLLPGTPAPAPHLVLTLNTMGATDITVSYDLRDVDATSRNTVQRFALQYRVGTSGNFTNVPAGYVADATTGPNIATLVTPVSAVLPAEAENEPVVEVRIISADASMQDEGVAVDNIAITATPYLASTGSATPQDVVLGGSTLLEVVVAPAACPPSTGITVTADLGPIGGAAAVPLVDDGMSGDETPGDNVFSRLVTIDPQTTLGPAELTIFIDDAAANADTTAITLAVFVATSVAQEVEERFWITDGPVTTILPVGSTVYIGGEFTYVGPNTGPGAVIDGVTGEVESPPLAIMGINSAYGGDCLPNGLVWAVLPDGSGGWFLGGEFTEVGGQPRLNLAHLLANGTVSPWNPSADGEVHALALDGSTLYVGGYFTNVGGAPRNYIAALDAVTGVPTAWNPSADGFVQALAVSDTTVFVGGGFDVIGGSNRPALAALSTLTGDVEPFAQEIENGTVAALVTDGQTVYAAGTLQPFALPSRRLMAFDVATGLATGFHPAPNAGVSALLLDGGLLYVGGSFSLIAGQARTRLAALDVSTELATAWSPSVPNGLSSVLSLAVTDGTLYVGGDFQTVDGQPRPNLAAFDMTSGLLKTWNPTASHQVMSLAASGSRVFAGGRFMSAGGVTRIGLAALDIVTGEATSWNPAPNNFILSMAQAGSFIYAGGQFTTIGGQSRPNVAQLDMTTGSATSWNPAPNGLVGAIVANDSIVYMGGEFTSAGLAARTKLAAVDASTGLATTFQANADQEVEALTRDGSLLYVSGRFGLIGGQSRRYYAALDASSGSVTPWNPFPGGEAGIPGGGIVPADSTVFISSRNGLFAVDPILGTPTMMNPDADGSVYALTRRGERLYVGGNFSQIFGESRGGLAEFDLASATATNWAPDIARACLNYQYALDIAVDDNYIYVGGELYRIGSAVRRNFAVYSLPYQSAVPDAPPVPRLNLASTPNPARGPALIHFTLPAAGPVTMDLFDVAGRRVVNVLKERRFEAGAQAVPLGTERLAPGIYFVRLVAGRQSASQKLVVVK